MRYMVMHKVDARMEAGEPPDPKLISEMGALIGRYLKAGTFKDGAGLHRSAARARVSFDAEGRPSALRGPYAGGNELLASFALVVTTGIEQAIELAQELGVAAGKREVEAGPVVETWDLKQLARPAGAPHRFLLLVKADATYEAGTTPSPAVRALLDRWKTAGILETEATLAPSKRAVRTNVVAGKRRWIDGPFTESKELVAGFSLLELPSLAEAKQFTEEYVGVLGDVEVDIRELSA